MKSARTKKKISAMVLASFLMAFTFLDGATAQRELEPEPTAILNFLIVKEDNGKPVRNAAVIMHAVNSHGKQGRGDLELKTDLDGKTSFDGVPYGKLRVQVLASGFQTYGEDFDIDKAKMDFTVKLKRPQGQYSIYQDHPGDKKDDKKDDKAQPPPDPNTKLQ